ncbi:hypothetical protein EON79_13650 [bacterium]|nr:MAG: hypothetical protein EON79_13650 [bacterium]
MNGRAINRYGGFVASTALLVVLVVNMFPNRAQFRLAESMADNLMAQSQRKVTETEQVGQGFTTRNLRDVESVADSYGDIRSFRRTGSRISLIGLNVDYEVRRTRALTKERVSLFAGWSKSYERDFASVNGHEVLSAETLR